MASGQCTSESAAPKLNANTLGCNGNTPLHEVVKKVECRSHGVWNRTRKPNANNLDEKHIQFIKLLLKFNPDVNVQNSEGYTPLHLAIKNQRSFSVLEAITKDSEYVFIDVNCVNKKGLAVIHEILNYRSDEDAIKILDFLIKLKADINKKNSKDDTILHLAIAKDGADLHQLSQNSSDLVIKAILDNKASQDATQMKNSDGYTPLHLAVKNQRSMDVLETLTKETGHVIIDYVNNQGGAAIHEIFNYTNSKDAIKVLALLMKFKADINKGNSKDETILHLAIAKNISDLTKAILDHGAHVNVANKQGCTALYNAVFPTHSSSNRFVFNFGFRDVGIVKHLVEKGAKIDTAAKNGYSPLHLAVVLKKTDYVKTMLENDSNLSEGGLEQRASTFCFETFRETYPSPAYYHMTPLLISVYDCNMEMAQMLIKAGASVNAVNSSGENALLMITNKALSFLSNENQEQEKIAKLLIENGVDLNAKDNLGGTALNYAIRNDIHEIVFHILERGLDTL